TRRGTFQNRARFGMSVFDHARKVRVAGTWTGQRCTASGIHGFSDLGIIHVQLFWVHDGGPLWPLSVANHDGNRAAQGIAMTDACQQRQFIRLKLHARTAAIAEATTSELE